MGFHPLIMTKENQSMTSLRLESQWETEELVFMLLDYRWFNNIAKVLIELRDSSASGNIKGRRRFEAFPKKKP